MPVASESPSSSRSPLGRGVVFLVVTLLAILALSGLLAWRARETLDLLQRADRVNRTLPQLHRVMQDLLNAETGQRGYLLTQKGSYLQPYRDALIGMEQRLNELVERDPDPMRQPRLVRVKELAAYKMEELAQTLRLNDSGRHAEALELVMSDQGQRHMDELRDLVGELLAELQAERGEINGRLQNETSQAELLLLAALGTLTLFTVLAITQVVMRTRQSERSEQRLLAIADNVPALIGQFDRERRLRFANAEAGRVFGFHPAAGVGKTMREIAGAEDAALLDPHMDRVLDGHPVEFDIDLMVNGQLRHLHHSFVPDRVGDRIEGFYAVSMDITPMKQAEAQLAQLASSDALTGLPNRREFHRALEGALIRQRRRAPEGEVLALLFLDVDRFKAINDSQGHGVGDEVLRGFADCVRRIVRTSDLVARLAGDEFVAVLEGLPSAEEAEQVAFKIIEAVRAQPIAGLEVTTSIGIATVADAEVPPMELLSLADRALYEAKRQGRDRFCVQHWPGGERAY